jgi:hypothetical protein
VGDDTFNPGFALLRRLDTDFDGTDVVITLELPGIDTETE